MDFTSSITLKFNDLFSSGFQQAYTSVQAFKGSLDGINGSSLGTAQSDLAGVGSALRDVNPAGLSGIGTAAASAAAPVREVRAEIDELEEMLGGSAAHLADTFEPLAGIGGASLPAAPDTGGAALSGFSGIKNVFGALKTDTVTNMKSAMGGMNDAMEQINKNRALNEMAAGMAVMANMTNPLRQSLSNMMGEPSRLAGNFETSMKNIQAITNKSNEEIKALGAELNRIGGRAAAGPLAVADAYNDVAGGITNLTAQMPVLNNALALAEAGQADLGTATNGLVKIMNSYNFTAGEEAEVNERAAWASDVMTQAVGMGVGSMNEFVSAMAPVSGMAASVGVGFDEVGATMAYMTATTDTAATAGTKLQSFITALQRPSDDLAAALATVGINSGSAMLAQYGLAESAKIISDVFNGDQDAIAQAMGRMEAMKAVVSLTGSTYADFAGEFGSTMDGITAKSQAVQTQSYESKLARLQAASGSLKIKMGEDINGIKGFFADMGTVFLTRVVAPIVNSPVGPAFSKLAALTGLAAKGVLDAGSGVLNAAAQFSVLAVNIQNAKGFTNLFKNSLQFLGAPFKAVGGMIAGFITNLIGVGASSGAAAAGTGALGAAGAASAGGIGAAAVATGGFAASLWAAAWPVLAIAFGVAALATGAYFLVKKWEAVSGFFAGLWNKITGALSGIPNWVLGLVAVFLPFVGIPLLVIKNWGAITGFFAGLWQKIKAVFSAAPVWIAAFFSSLAGSIGNFFSPVLEKISGALASFANWLGGIWNVVTGAFTAAWAYIVSFFSSVWNTMVSIVTNIGNWFISVWAAVTGAFAAAWTWVSGLFTGIWEGIKGVIMGFVQWLSPVIEIIAAPFIAIGKIIGGIIGTVAGWLGEAVDAGNAAVAGMELSKELNTELNQDVTRTVTSETALADIEPPPTETITAAVAAPSFGGPVTPLSDFSGAAATETVSGFAAARASAPDLTFTASSAFADALSGAGLAPAALAAIDEDVGRNFPAAMPPRNANLTLTRQENAARKENVYNSYHVNTVTINSEDIETFFDIFRQIEQAAHKPEEEAV
jgi:TP901 family phage tail tape measure protein